MLRIACAAVAFLLPLSSVQARELTVFAAASLTDALGEASAAYTRATGVTVRLSFAASSALARQIEAGARADVFFSADAEWLDYLQRKSLIDTATRRNVAGNRLVLIAPADSTVTLRVAPHLPLRAAIGSGRLAIGDPDIVPVGRYSRSALTTLGVWNDVAQRVVRADNVRAALAYVARGEANLGVVYATDAKLEKRVRVVAVFPADLHAPIVYPIAALRTARPGANSFIEFMCGDAGKAILLRYGFTPP